MRSIKQQVLKSRIRVGEFLREFDPLRKGFITKHQLEVGGAPHARVIRQERGRRRVVTAVPRCRHGHARGILVV